jgi:hypothetical protein
MKASDAPQHKFPAPKNRQGGFPPWPEAAVFSAVPADVLVVFLVVPLIALIWRALEEPTLWSSLSAPLVIEALRVPRMTTAVTLLVTTVTGTPLAYLLARRDFRAKGVVELMTDQPMVLPPVVAGVALLQTEQGAPFTMFLAADEGFGHKPAEAWRTLDQGMLYATCRIVLFAPYGSPLTDDPPADRLDRVCDVGIGRRLALDKARLEPWLVRSREIP